MNGFYSCVENELFQNFRDQQESEVKERAYVHSVVPAVVLDGMSMNDGESDPELIEVYKRSRITREEEEQVKATIRMTDYEDEKSQIPYYVYYSAVPGTNILYCLYRDNVIYGAQNQEFTKTFVDFVYDMYQFLTSTTRALKTRKPLTRFMHSLYNSVEDTRAFLSCIAMYLHQDIVVVETDVYGLTSTKTYHANKNGKASPGEPWKLKAEQKEFGNKIVYSYLNLN